jgi:hypothetical protein
MGSLAPHAQAEGGFARRHAHDHASGCFKPLPALVGPEALCYETCLAGGDAAGAGLCPEMRVGMAVSVLADEVKTTARPR